jgi:type I restriction enzyme S subunit
MKSYKARFAILNKIIKGSPGTHNPDFESVDYLIDESKKYRLDLIDDGLLRRDKLVSDIYTEDGHVYEVIGDNAPVCIDDELPFCVPDNWCWTRLRSISISFNNKRTPLSQKKRVNMEKIYPYYGSSGEIDKVDEYVFNGKFLLVVEDSGILTSGKNISHVVEGKFSTNNHVHVFKVCDLLVDFVSAYLNSLDFQSSNLITGAVVPKLNQSNLKNILIPLPPLEEQEIILDIINRLDYYHMRMKKYNDKLEEFNKNFIKDFKISVLHESITGELSYQNSNNESAKYLIKCYPDWEELVNIPQDKWNDFGEYSFIRRVGDSYYEYENDSVNCIDDLIPFDIPDNWLWVRMRNYVEILGGSHESLNYVSEGYPVITSKNLKNNRIDFDNVNYVSEEDYLRLSKSAPIDEGDILFGVVGNIGNPVRVSEFTDFCIKNVVVFKPYVKNLDLTYFYSILRYAELQIKEHAFGVAQPFVSLDFLRNFLVPLPPLEDQVNMSKKIARLSIELRRINDILGFDGF